MDPSLTHYSLLEGLPPAVVKEFNEFSRERQFKAGAPLFYQDSEGTEGYLVMTGAVRIERLNHQGGRVLLNILGPGEFIGETSMVTGKNRFAECVAQIDTTVRIINKDNFKKMIATHAAFSERFICITSERLHRVGVKLEEVSLIPLKARLAGLLLDFMRRFGTSTGKQGSIDIKLTQSDMAELASSSREHINKILKIWEKEKIIKISKNNIAVLDADKLWNIHDNSSL